MPMARSRLLRCTRHDPLRICAGMILFAPVTACAGAGNIPPAAETQIRVARSADGLDFEVAGAVAFDHAAAPSVVQLRDGTLLVVLDRARGDGAYDTALAISRSTDHGATWSPPARVRITGVDSRLWDTRHGALALSSDGEIRLYFVAVRKSQGRDSSGTTIDRALRGGVLILSAISSDGKHFRLDPRTRIRLDRVADAHPTAVWMDRRLHLFAAQAREDSGIDASVAHFVSQDGHTFGRVADFSLPIASFLGTVQARGRGMLALMTGPEGIVSLTSRDGRYWQKEGGVRLTGGWHPAVYRLADDFHIMLYCTRSTSPPGAADTLADLPQDEGEYGTESYGSGEGEAVALAADGDRSGGLDGDAASLEPMEDLKDLAALADTGESDLSAESARPLNAPTADLMARDARDLAGYDEPAALALWEHADPLGFAPRPDFRHKVDYLEWYLRFGLPNPPDNAYHAYATFMPMSSEESNNPPWPEKFQSIYDAERDTPPGPWNPGANPEWEATNLEWQPLIDKFREATEHAGYATPAEKVEVRTTDVPDGEKLLIGIMLPSLASHRQLAKATLADAWRTEDGKIDPRRMIDALSAVLRGANHMSQGTTLIEDLVGTAERRLAHETAAQALAHNVFSGDDLLDALDALLENDFDDRDPASLIKGEHAFSMDIIQHLFSPVAPDGSPQINIGRAEAVHSSLGDDAVAVSDLLGLGPRDAYAAIDAFDAHYREFAELVRVGYPAVRATEIETLTQERVHTNAITRMFMPSLSRYYKLKARSETSRRATQLVYATHVFKAETGRWPESLSELSTATVPGLTYADIERMRIDPFSGGYFGYRVGENGPRIWSASENGLDDGGVHAPRWDDEPDPTTGSDDHVFWPVQLTSTN